MNDELMRINLGVMIFFVTVLLGVDGYWFNNSLETSEVMGCFIDDFNVPDLTYQAQKSSTNTQESCVALCKDRWFKFAAVQNGDTCWCGQSFGKYGKASLHECSENMCPGDLSKTCGGFRRNLVVDTTYNSGHAEEENQCWKEVSDPERRTLTYKGDKLTRKYCRALCGAFREKFAAVKNQDECWCGEFFNGGMTAMNSCKLACSGSTHESCGGKNSLFVMPSERTDLDQGLLIAAGCYTVKYLFPLLSKTNKKVMLGKTGTMTYAVCRQGCKEKGYKLAGVQKGFECWCGDIFIMAKVYLTDEEYCSTPCTGDATQLCGAKDYIFVIPPNAS